MGPAQQAIAERMRAFYEPAFFGGQSQYGSYGPAFQMPPAPAPTGFPTKLPQQGGAGDGYNIGGFGPAPRKVQSIEQLRAGGVTGTDEQLQELHNQRAQRMIAYQDDQPPIGMANLAGYGKGQLKNYGMGELQNYGMGARFASRRQPLLSSRWR